MMTIIILIKSNIYLNLY